MKKFGLLIASLGILAMLLPPTGLFKGSGQSILGLSIELFIIYLGSILVAVSVFVLYQSWYKVAAKEMDESIQRAKK